MTTTTTFQKVAEEVSESLVSDVRNDGTTFYKFAEDAPQWLKDENVSHTCHEAVDDRMPDDWVYEQMHYIADRLEEYENADDARDAMGDIADGLVDVYNLDRAKWLAMHLNNALLCDEAMQEFGWDKEGGLYQLIGMGQYLAIERIGNALIECIEKEAEARDVSDDADDGNDEK